MPKEDPPAGVPDWIVTYGDMMSLLLTFFIMLVSLSEIKGDSKYQKMVEAIMKHLGYISAPAGPSGDGFPLSAVVHGLGKLGGPSKAKSGLGGVKSKGLAGSDVRVFNGPQGLGVRVSGDLAFSGESAQLSQDGREVLKNVAVKLRGKPNKIELRGHVGASSLRSLNQAEKLNLSYRRARAVMDLLVAEGVRRERLRITALGDSEPPSGGTEIQSEPPDRVEIYVLDAFARDFIGRRETPTD